MRGPESVGGASLVSGAARSAWIRARSVAGVCLLLTCAWPAVVRAQVAPDVSLNGQLFPSLSDAVAAALPGETVLIGAGVLTLSAPLALGAGVSIEGVSAHATLLDAAGLEVGIRIAEPASAGVGVRGIEVSGAVRGIEVTGARGVVIRQVALRDNQESGLYVGDDSEVTVVNATLVRNGAGIISAGSGVVHVRNSVITAGGAGLSSAVEGGLLSSYDDLFGNTGPAYQHVRRGMGDLTYQPMFVDLAQNDLRLTDVQPITDRGDPTDDFSAELQPNGRRINLGAFGGTAEAELSMTPPPDAGGGCAVAGIAGRGADSSSGALAWALFTTALLTLVTTRPRPGAVKTSSTAP